MTETTTLTEEPELIHRYGYWFDGQKRGTYCEAETVENVVIELQDLTADAPEDLPGWRVKNLKTKETWTGTEFLARHG